LLIGKSYIVVQLFFSSVEPKDPSEHKAAFNPKLKQELCLKQRQEMRRWQPLALSRAQSFFDREREIDGHRRPAIPGLAFSMGSPKLGSAV